MTNNMTGNNMTGNNMSGDLTQRATGGATAA